MTEADILGHIGYALLGLGMFLIARKRISGWMFRLAGEIVWLRIGFMLEMSSVILWGVFFAGMELYGFQRWRKDRKRNGNSGS